MFDNNKHNQKSANFLKTIGPSEKLGMVGQVGGLDTDPAGNLVIFHRGSRKWSFK